jgi:hypothetical protein
LAARAAVALDGGGCEWAEGRASGGLKDVLATLERSGVDERSGKKIFIENK